MALMKCPECGLQISDKALSCPHCGYPLDNAVKKKKGRGPATKRKRLPNGFGSITEIKGKNLRNPFFARVCVGKTELNKPIVKSLKPQAYFKTYNEAYEALMEYNKNPYDLDKDITAEQLYELWTTEYFAQIADNSARNITSAWAYCSSVYKMRVKDIRIRHIKGCIDDGFRIEERGKNKGKKKYTSPVIKGKIKSTFNLMLDYAMEHDIVTTNYARSFDLTAAVTAEQAAAQTPHIPFTAEELQILWNNVGKVPYVDWILIQCYMGWRPQELATLRLDEVHLDQWYMQAGMKTDAGKQRIVPIHTRIRDFVKKKYDYALSIGSVYLLNDKSQTSGSWKLSYDKYASRFKKVVKQLNLNPDHRAHDPRKTFVTNCKKAGVDEYAIKAMVGHNIKDITEATYTVRDLEWLRSDLEKLP